MMACLGPPAKGVGGPIPSADALGTVEETPLATAGGTRPPAITAAPPPLGTAIPGGTEEPSSTTYVDLHLLRRNDLHLLRRNEDSKEGTQHQATENGRPQRFTTPITHFHNQPYYTDHKPSSVYFQRQHQGELCPISRASVKKITSQNVWPRIHSN